MLTFKTLIFSFLLLSRLSLMLVPIFTSPASQKFSVAPFRNAIFCPFISSIDRPLFSEICLVPIFPTIFPAELLTHFRNSARYSSLL